MKISRSNTPQEILGEAWKILKQAGEEPQHAFHLPTLISQGDTFPEGRIVVLREVASEKFRIYTDARSPKVEELRKHPNSSLLFWDPGHGLQIRVKGTTSFLSQQETAELFASFPAEQTSDYGSDLPPGTPINPEETLKKEATSNQHNFCVLEVEAEKMDILQLQNEGHLRLQFKKDLEGSWKGSWVVP